MSEESNYGSIREVIRLGNPILRQKAMKVDNFAEIQQLIDDMIATVKDQKGFGIAAPQVGSSYRLFILNSYPTEKSPNLPKRLVPIINPKIAAHSEEMIDGFESCLSIPDKIAQVPRYTSVSLEYMTRDGEMKKESFEGFIARIIQHEYDHLEGIVYLDRVKDSSTIMSIEEFLQKQK